MKKIEKEFTMDSPARAEASPKGPLSTGKIAKRGS
jgi:hypothetical protein